MSSSEAIAAVTGSDLVIDCLAAEGVRNVFGLPGTTVMDLIDSLARRDGIRYLSTRHEQVAGFMADGFSRAGGVLGVCLASRGPGATNLSIAVQNANDESIGMLALIGQVPSSLVERGSFEEMDIVAAFRPISKWTVEITDVNRVPELLQRAIRTATSGRPGPVVVSLPLDVLQAVAQVRPQPSVRVWPPAPDPASIAAAVELIRRAEKPITILGGGTARVEHSVLSDFARSLQSPVVTTWLRKNVFPNDDPAFAGSLGYGSHEVSDDLVRKADLVVAIGCRFSEFTTKRWTLIEDGVPLIHVDIDPAELGRVYPPTVGITSEAGLAIRAITNAMNADGQSSEKAAKARSCRVREVSRIYAAARTAPSDSVPLPGKVTSLALVEAIRILSNEPNVVIMQDVHSFGPWVQRYVDFNRPMSYFGSAGGAMAWGFPAAMGMALARPDQRVVALSGDGSFWMVAQDFETCIREQIPVVNVVVNNFAYGNTRDRQRYSHDGRYCGVFLGNPDFAEFARMLGGYGERVTAGDALNTAIERALQSGLPAIVDVIQDRLEGLPSGLVPLRAN